MTRLSALNLAVALLALVSSAWLSLPSHAIEAKQATLLPQMSASAEIVREHGREGLRDVTGHFVPLQRYTRIASTSGVTDSLLLALSEPDRIATFTRFSTQDSPFAYRYAGKPTLVDIAHIETLIALKPDLVLVNSLGGSDRIERLRDAGLRVFDLGEMRGLATLLPNFVTTATLLGRPEIGRLLAARFERRMRTLASQIPMESRPRALYISIYGDSIYGGAPGTSYHDVMIAAGLRDAAEGKFRDWPRYTSETLLGLDPEVVVTHTGMARVLCTHPGLDKLRACSHAGRVVELSGSLLDDPSLIMLEAAETVFDAVYPASGAPR